MSNPKTKPTSKAQSRLEYLTQKLGFNLRRNSSHFGRTIMLRELSLVLDCVHDPIASHEEYIDAILEQNCLQKKSVSNRRITARRLTELYSLDPSIPLFRALVFLWNRDENARPQLSVLCSLARDSVFKEIASKIVELPVGAVITREHTEQWLDELEHDRFTTITRASIAKNINSSWTQAGYLIGKIRKVRRKPLTSPGSVAYALFLSYLTGARGSEMLRSEYVRVLDCASTEVLQLAQDASRQGWITLRHIGEIVEVTFPNFLNAQDLELLHEQNR